MAAGEACHHPPAIVDPLVLLHLYRDHGFNLLLLDTFQFGSICTRQNQVSNRPEQSDRGFGESCGGHKDTRLMDLTHKKLTGIQMQYPPSREGKTSVKIRLMFSSTSIHAHGQE